MRATLLILFITLSFESNFAQWVTGSIDTITHDHNTDYAFSPNSIAVDNQNTIHVVWQKKDRESDPNSWRIYYTRKLTGGNWINPIAISDTLIASVYPSVVVSDKLHKTFISYLKWYDYFTSAVMLAVGDENLNWTSQNISDDYLQNRNLSIAIDNDENVHLVWLGMDSLFNDKVKYSNNKNGEWEIQTLNDNYFGDNYYAFPTLSVSHYGAANILYLSIIGGISRIIHAENFDKKINHWSFGLLPEFINGSGFLRISKRGKLNYIFGYTKDFQFPYKTLFTFKDDSSSNWSFPQLIDENFDGFCTSVEVDNEENIHLTLDSLKLAFKMGKIYYATNKSGTWKLSPVSNNGRTFFSSFALDNKGIGHVISSNENSLFYTDLIHLVSENSLISISENSSFYNKEFILFQNYPNPFNPSTTIEFKIPKTQFVKITIYNLQGKQMKALINQSLTAGTHQIKFHSTNLNSGVYFYRIESPSFSDTRKMIILK